MGAPIALLVCFVFWNSEIASANPHRSFQRWYGAGADGLRQGWGQQAGSGWVWKGRSWPQPFGVSRKKYGVDARKLKFDSLWRSSGTVPDKLSQVPDQPLDVQYGNIRVTANDILDASQTLKKPVVHWDADPGSLYTLYMEDQDVPFPGAEIKFNHWMVTNIPGNNIGAGDEMTDYLPPSPSALNEDGTLNKTLPAQGGYTHRYAFLVYKQNDRIDVPGQIGCTEDVLTSRISINHDDLQKDYNLEGPVAGNFMRVGYSPKGSIEYYTCQLSNCAGGPIPLVIPGVNDKLPDCPPCPVCTQ